MSTDLSAVEAKSPQIAGISKGIPIQELAELFGLEKSILNDDEALFQFAWKEYGTAVYGMARAGAALAIIKARLGHGKYEKFLLAHKLTSQRASEMTRVADRMSALHREDARRIAAMRPRKVIALSWFKPKELKWAIEHDQLELLASMSAVDRVKWRDQRETANVQRAAEALPPSDESWEAPAQEPPSLIVARDELLSGVIRARIELERPHEVVKQLLRSTDDDFEQARVEAVFAARKILAAVIEEAHKLDAMLDARFSASPAFAGEGPERVRVNALIASKETVTALDADGSLTLRAKALAANRQGWVGAPPKSVGAWITKARKLDKLALAQTASDEPDEADEADESDETEDAA